MDYEPIVKFLTKRFYPYSLCDYDDLMQSGYLGAVKAMDTYDSTKGPLTAWLFRCVKAEIINTVFRGQRKGREQAYIKMVFESPHIYADEPLSPYEIIILPEIEEERHKLRNKILDELISGDVHILKKNNRLNSRIFLDHYYYDMTIKEIAEKYKMTCVKIARRIDHIMQYFRKKYKVTKKSRRR